MKKRTLLFATGSKQKYGFPYNLHREVVAVAVAAVAAVPQKLARKPWWPRPLCCKCWHGGRAGRGRAANAGVVAAVVVAAVAQMHILPILYHMVA